MLLLICINMIFALTIQTYLMCLSKEIQSNYPHLELHSFHLMKIRRNRMILDLSDSFWLVYKSYQRINYQVQIFKRNFNKSRESLLKIISSFKKIKESLPKIKIIKFNKIKRWLTKFLNCKKLLLITLKKTTNT